MVNVLDPARHRTTVTDEVLSLDSNTLKAKTKKPGLISVTSLKSGDTLLREDTDYAVDLQTGEFTFKTTKANLKATYIYADPAKVTEADIKGGIDSATGKRKGFELLRDGFNLYGADAKILICPEFDKTASCAAALATLAEQRLLVLHFKPSVARRDWNGSAIDCSCRR